MFVVNFWPLCYCSCLAGIARIVDSTECKLLCAILVLKQNDQVILSGMEGVRLVCSIDLGHHILLNTEYLPFGSLTKL